MLKTSAAASRNNSAVIEKAHDFPVEVFESFSKEELLAVLSLMHRILDSDRRRDVKRIIKELPKLFPKSADTQDACQDNGDTGRGGPGEHPSKGEKTYHILTYLFSCLSKVQTEIHPAGISQMTSVKNTCHLSPRELTVLRWMKEGKTNWEIARILGLSERTVRYHVSGIFKKLDVKSRTQAVARALGTGLIAS